MQRKFTWFCMLSGAVAVTALYTGRALATPSSGFTGTTLALGRLSDVDVFNYFVPPVPAGQDTPPVNPVWFSLQKTKGPSDLYVQTNVWAPGGSTGWHSHPGHSIIVVTAGTITAYEGDDPDCKPTVYTKGMAFVDPGGGHIHIIRNEGDVDANTIAIQVIPADGTRRIDVDSPGNCTF